MRTPADPYSGGGHIITVVGWDDDYDKNNFTGNPYIAEETGVDIPLPKNNGAFICKNSWGRRGGEKMAISIFPYEGRLYDS